MKGIALTGIFALLSCFIGCKRELTDLETALQFAGENRVELEKVLNRYGSSPQDSLKYKAAVFLIENMPYHYYYQGEQLNQYAEYYQILSEERHINPIDILDSMTLKYGKFILGNLQVKYDIKEIDSAYLCHNIEWSFKVWTEQPWGKNISFDDFCEYILPYRLGNEEPVYWREDYYRTCISVFENINSYKNADDPLKAVMMLTDSLRKIPYRFTETAPPGMPNLGPKVTKYLSGSCRDITDFTLYACRALGIPSHLDFMPLRGDENNGHFWVSYEDRKHHLFIQDFLDAVMPVRSSHLALHFKKLKVYRYTFSQNREMKNRMKRLGNSVYPFFRYPNLKDVTAYYADYLTEQLTVPAARLYDQKTREKIVYLCLASGRNWIPVDWTEFNKSSLCFRHVAQGCVARIATWEDDQLMFQSPPFFISPPWGELIFFSDTGRKEEVTLLSKTNLKNDDLFLDRMIGGIFEGSNNRNFKIKDTLHIIYDKPDRLQTSVWLATDNRYRYVRYVGGKESFCNVSEIAFYENREDTVPLQGDIIGTSGAFLNDPAHELPHAFDGKTDTSFDYKDGTGGWAGLDLGEAKKISRIVYTPRNRDNFIRPGDEYELFYLGKDWISLGKIKAASDSLLYRNVPAHTLLYLKNHTRGVEERIFTYEDGEQVWR